MNAFFFAGAQTRFPDIHLCSWYLSAAERPRCRIAQPEMQASRRRKYLPIPQADSAREFVRNHGTLYVSVLQTLCSVDAALMHEMTTFVFGKFPEILEYLETPGSEKIADFVVEHDIPVDVSRFSTLHGLSIPAINILYHKGYKLRASDIQWFVKIWEGHEMLAKFLARDYTPSMDQEIDDAITYAIDCNCIRSQAVLKKFTSNQKEKLYCSDAQCFPVSCGSFSSNHQTKTDLPGALRSALQNRR